MASERFEFIREFYLYVLERARTKKEIAKKTGIDRVTLWNIETRKTDTVLPDTEDKLFKTYPELLIEFRQSKGIEPKDNDPLLRELIDIRKHSEMQAQFLEYLKKDVDRVTDENKQLKEIIKKLEEENTKLREQLKK